MTISNTFTPSGTVVSIHAPSLHLNPELFYDPDSFMPGRWIDGKALDKYLVSFGRGPRACIGQK
jgi:cytochrome P450